MGFWDGFTEVQNSVSQSAEAAAKLRQQQLQAQGQSAAGQAFFGAQPGGGQPPSATNPLAALGSKIGGMMGMGGGQAPQQPSQGGQQQPQGGGQPMGQMDLPTLVQRIKSQNPNASPQVMMSALSQSLPALNAQGRAQLAAIKAQKGQQPQGGMMGMGGGQAEAGRNTRFQAGQEGQDRRQGAREDRIDARSFATQTGIKDRFEKTMQAAHDKLLAAQSEKARASALSEMRALQSQYDSAVKNQINADKNLPSAQRDALIKDQAGVAANAKQRLDDEIMRLRGAAPGEPPPAQDQPAPRAEGAPKMDQQAGPVAASDPGTAQQLKQVHNADDYAALMKDLKSGDQYLDPDNNVRIKK